MLAHAGSNGLDDRLVALGERSERGGHLPRHVGEPGPELRRVPVPRGLAERADPLGQLLPGAPDRFRDVVQGVLEPRRPHGERLEALVRVRDQAPERLIPRQLEQDLGPGVVLVAARGPPDLARDLAHERGGGDLDAAESLLELALDRSPARRSSAARRACPRRRYDILRGALVAAGEEAAAPRPVVAGRRGRNRLVHMGARIPGPARRVASSVGEGWCNITHLRAPTRDGHRSSG